MPMASMTDPKPRITATVINNDMLMVDLKATVVNNDMPMGTTVVLLGDF